MKYFNNFPKTLFLLTPASYKKPAEYVSITDITRNVRFKKEVIDQITLYDTYNIKDGDTPEIVSEKLYDTPYYHWVIMLLNERYDYIRDFPLSQTLFDEYMNDTYDSVEVEGQSYIQTVYGTSSAGLIVDLVQDGNSVDIEGNLVLTNRQTQAQVTKPIRSVWAYDEVIDMNVKKFVYTDVAVDGSYFVDQSVWNVNLGAIPSVQEVTLYNKELEKNTEKAQIKVISQEMLQLVISNFKELM